MLANAATLMLFPALMAFAASSDLLTMTISNRVSLILVAGFFVLAFVDRHEPGRSSCAHVGAAGAGAGRRLRASSRAAGSAAATPSLRPRPRFGSGSTSCCAYLIYASLFGGLLTLLLLQVPHACRCRAAGRSGMGGAPAPQGLPACPTASRSRCRARRLSGHALDEGDRRLTPADRDFASCTVARRDRAATRADIASRCVSQSSTRCNQRLTRFRYRSLTML